MSLSTWLRTLASGSPQKTIRRIRRDEASPRSRLKLLLELLEDRLAPAVFTWTGAAADTTAFVPGGLTGFYYQAISGAGAGATLNPTNVNSLFNNNTPTVTALTPDVDFPSIGSNGKLSFTLRGAAAPIANFSTTADPNSSNVGALFEGQIYLSHLGKYTFGTASDDGSALWLDSTDPNSSAPLAGSVEVVNNDAAQGRTLKSGTYTNTTIGLHNIIIGYWNGGGGASMTAYWSPTGATLTDSAPAGVIPSSVLYSSATASSWSNAGNWAGGVAPAATDVGDTLVFDSSVANYKPSTASVNDIPGMTINGIVVNNPAGATQDPAQIIQGDALTITNTPTAQTSGITANTGGLQSTISFAKITLGGNATISDISAAPTSTTPALDIISNIDLAGHTLTEGKGLGSSPDTGLTEIDGIISSSVPTTDSVVENGSGYLALTGTNTFDTAAQVTQGILVDAGTQSLGKVGATVAGAGAFLGISNGDSGTYSTGVTLATGASIIKVDSTAPTESFPIILTGNATIADGVGANRATGNPTFNGNINLGANTLTIDINAGAGVAGAAIPAMFFGTISGVAGANLTKIGVGRAKLQVDNPNLVASINVNGGYLSVASAKALGTGANAVTVASGASLAFQGGITTPAAQGVTITGSGVGGHGAIFAWDSADTFAGPITVSSGDLYAGGTGGNVTLTAPITLGPDNLQLVGTGNGTGTGNLFGNITVKGAITGAAGTQIIKSDTGSDTISTNNTATFLGTTTINAGVLNITTDGALGAGAITEAGGSLGLSSGITYTGALSLSGPGANNAGAVESLNGTDTITGAITQSAAGSLGASSGTTLVLPDAINNSGFDLTLTGNGGTTNVTGVISGSGGLIKNGSGTANLNAVMTYTGPTTINGGILAITNPAAINAGGAITINAGSLGLPNGANVTKAITLNGGAIEALAGNVNSTITGNIMLTANSFLKSDAGTLTVNGNINLNGFTLTGLGAANIVVNGAISGNTTNTPTAGLQGSYYATNALPSGTGDFLLDPNNSGYIGNDIPTFTDTTPQINFGNVSGNGFAPDDPNIKGSNVAAHWVGSIMIDNAGIIQFESASDDGSVVFIDGQLVVNNPGGHGSPGPTPFGKATLAAGLHSIEVIYYQGGGGASEVLSWDPLDTNTYVVVPADHLFTASTNAVDKDGTGTMTLNGANTYLGGTNINTGILVAGNATALNPSGAPVNINGGSLGLPAVGGVTLPANQVLNLNGGTIENLGGSNTIAAPLSLSIPSSITSDAGTLTLNGNINQNVGDLTFTGAGNTVVNGVISGAATPTVAGLLESQLNNSDPPSFAPVGSATYGTDIELTPFMGETSGNDHALLPVAQHTWGTTDEWVYTGQMYWPNYNGTGIGYISFAKAIDDDTSVIVDGVSYLYSTAWNVDGGTGEIALPSGFHNVDFRFSNGGGGAGADGQETNGWSGFTQTEGFVYRVDQGPNDPFGGGKAVGAAPGTAGGFAGPSANAGNIIADGYSIPTDPGDGSLFRQSGPPAVIEGGTGTTTFTAANTYSGRTVINSGTIVLANVNGLGVGDGTAATGTSVGGGSLALEGGITFPTTEALSLSGTGANGAGALENLSGNNTVTQALTLSGDATIGSTAGNLTLNGNITSPGVNANLTFTGAGTMTVNGTVTGGTPILNLTGNYYSGLTTGATSGILDPTSANWIGTYTPVLTAPLTTSIQFTNTGVGGTGFPPYTSLSGSNIGALWVGTINILQSTPISFLTGSDDGSRMWIDPAGPTDPIANLLTTPNLVVDNFFDQGVVFRSNGPETLTPGLHNIAIAYYNGGGGGGMFANWDLTGTVPAGYNSGTVAGVAIPVALPGVVNLTKTGSGTVDLAAPTGTYLGTTTVNGGVLTVNGDASLGASPQSEINIGAGTLDIISGASYSSTHPYNVTDPAATIQLDGAATDVVTLNQSITGPGGLTKTGTGTLSVGGSNPFFGGLTVSKGTVDVTNAGAVGSGKVTLAGGLLSINSPPPKEAPLTSATGWNQDVIWANSEASPVTGTTSGVDGSGTGNYRLYETGSLFAPVGSGLPHNGVITSVTSGLTYQLQPYTASNDLNIAGSGGTGTLTLATATASNPNSFQSLSFLDTAAGGGNANYTAKVTFSDGTSTTFANLVAPDMAGTTNPAIGGLGRIKADGTASYDSVNHGQLFDQTVTLSAADSAKVVTSVTFTDNSGPKLNVFALSGLENFTTLSFNNNVAVTAASEVDVATNAATMGNLSIGNNLTVGGTVPLTLGNVTLTGNSTLAPVTGQTVTVGNVGGSGFLTTSGPGTINLGSIGSGVTLGGSGTIADAVTVNSGGAVNPGSPAGTAGTLTTNGITFSGGSTYDAEIGGKAAGASDQISSGGTITLGNAILNVSDLGGYTPAVGDQITIIKNTGGSAIAGTFLNLPEGAGVSVNGKPMSISYLGGSGHDVVLTATASGPATHMGIIAEQSTYVIGATPPSPPVTFSVTALDANGVPASGFTDTVHYTSTDPKATLPADGPLTNSTGAFNVTFGTQGNQTVTVTDVTNPNITLATSLPVAVTLVVPPGPTTNFLVSAPSTTPVGAQFQFTITPRDNNNTLTGSGYTGTVHFTSTDPTAVLPKDTTLINGVGTFTATLSTVGGQTISVNDTKSLGIAGTSNVIQVGTVATGTQLVVSAPTATPTNTGFNVKVTAEDLSGNVLPGYTDAVTLSSNGVTLGTHTFTAADAGVFTFTNVKLTNAGTATLQALNTTSKAPIIIGFGTINAAGLTPTVTSTPTGFKISFNEAVNPKDVTLYGGAGAVDDLTVVNSSQVSFPGTLVFSADDKTAWFNVTDSFLAASNVNATASLPDDTYTVTLVSAATPNGNGFQDVNGLGMDPSVVSGGQYSTSIPTTYASSPMLGLLDFARGPNASGDTTTVVKVGNDVSNGGHVGIPVTLYNAAAVKSAGFTVTYNSQILTITGGIADPSNAGSSFTMTGTPVLGADGIHSVATFAYTNATAVTGTAILGDIVAFVPNSAKTQYQVKDLMVLGGITTTPSATVLGGSSVDVNAYFGAVDGTPGITPQDKNLIDAVTKGASGFPAFRNLDPAIIGDLTGGTATSDNAVTVTSTSLMTKFLSGKLPLPAGIPVPPSIPASQFHSPDTTDPIVSLPGAISSSSNGVVSVPVLLDHPVPQGSTGLTEAQLALTYDPRVLSVSSADITLGTIPGSGTGWTITSVVDQATGQIGIEIYSLTPITSAQAGSLVNIAFHVVPGAQAAATGVRLVDSVTPNGQFYSTVLADTRAAMTLSPGQNSLDVLTGLTPQVVTQVTTSSEVLPATGQVTVDGLTTGVRDEVEATYLTANVDQGEAASLAVLSNGSVVGEGSAHAVPANVVVTGALAFQTTAVAATQLAGQAFQVGNTGWLSSLLATNNPQQLADRLFLAMARLSDTPVDLSTLPESSLKSLTWDAAPQATWLGDTSDATVADTQTNAQDQQAAAIADHVAALDRIFADLGASQIDELGDLGDN